MKIYIIINTISIKKEENMYYIGLDLGTGSLKGLLVDSHGKILKQESAAYPADYFNNGWSEQNPADWLAAAKSVLSALSRGVEEEVASVAIGGQMHGLVMLDSEDNVIRPAILWNDGRAVKQTEYLNTIIGTDKINEYTANIAFAGFTAPKILWVKENEPDNFAKIAKIMLPKDYLAYMLTGVFSTDYSDASGMLLLDVKNKSWSQEMCSLAGVQPEWLPKLYESFEVTGKIKEEYLPNAVMVAGAADNAASAIGTGTVLDGDCNISLGTSGTVFIARRNFSEIENNSLHSFVHATGKWHFLGCILSAASSNKWWLESILHSREYDAEVKNAEFSIGKNPIIFLPYLTGERSPHNDVNARGAFIGLRADTKREEMNLAVLEGVAFALRDCIEAARANGLKIDRATVCGGGAHSTVWKKILANVLNLELCSLETEEGAAYGAAILAMTGCGVYHSVEEAATKLVNVKESVLPNPALVKAYEDKYATFRKLYPALKEIFPEIK